VHKIKDVTHYFAAWDDWQGAVREYHHFLPIGATENAGATEGLTD
jgi:hypothetical protein